MNGTEKISIEEFAQKIKTKYPEYKDIDDDELTQKIIQKYPEYLEQVDTTLKKKIPIASPSSAGTSAAQQNWEDTPSPLQELLQGEQQKMETNPQDVIIRKRTTEQPTQYQPTEQEVAIRSQIPSVVKEQQRQTKAEQMTSDELEEQGNKLASIQFQNQFPNMPQPSGTRNTDVEQEYKDQQLRTPVNEIVNKQYSFLDEGGKKIVHQYFEKLGTENPRKLKELNEKSAIKDFSEQEKYKYQQEANQNEAATIANDLEIFKARGNADPVKVNEKIEKLNELVGRQKEIIKNYPKIERIEKLQKEANEDYEKNRAAGSIKAIPSEIYNAVNKGVWGAIATGMDIVKLKDDKYSFGDKMVDAVNQWADDNTLITPKKEAVKMVMKIELTGKDVYADIDTKGNLQVYDKNYAPLKLTEEETAAVFQKYGEAETEGKDKEILTDFWTVIPQSAYQLTNMYVGIGLTGKILQASSKLKTGLTALDKAKAMSNSMSIMAGSYFNTYQDYKKYGLDNGMTIQQAEAFARPSALAVGMTESIYGGLEPFKFSKRAALKGFFDKGTKGVFNQTVEIVKDGSKRSLQEVVEEYANVGTDYINETAANTSLGKEVFNPTITANELLNTAVLTLGTMGFAEMYKAGSDLASIYRTKNSQKFWHTAAQNIDDYKAYLDKEVAEKQFSQDFADKMYGQAVKYKKAMDAIPADVPVEKKEQIVPVLAEKQEAEEKAAADVDDVFKETAKQAVKEKAEEIRKILEAPAIPEAEVKKEGVIQKTEEDEKEKAQEADEAEILGETEKAGVTSPALPIEEVGQKVPQETTQPKPIKKDMGVDIYFDEGNYTVYDASQLKTGDKGFIVSKKGYGKVEQFDTAQEALNKAQELVGQKVFKEKGQKLTSQDLAGQKKATEPTEQELQAEHEKQIADFGVKKEQVKNVSAISQALSNTYEKLGLGKAVDYIKGLVVGRAKGEEKPYALKISGKEVQVKNVMPEVVNGFYSPLEKTINETKFDKLPAKQWIDKFAKGQEAKWTGLTEWLNQQQGSVSKSDIQNYLKENRVQVVEVVKSEADVSRKEYISRRMSELDSDISNWEEIGLSKEEKIAAEKEYDQLDKEYKSKYEMVSTRMKYEPYQVAGEKQPNSYKEVLITMPAKGKSNIAELNKYVKEIEAKYKLNFSAAKGFMNDAELQHYEDLYMATERQYDNAKFKSPHFDEPNILAHLRMNIRTIESPKAEQFNADYQWWIDSGKKGHEPNASEYGKDTKVLFIEEIQSDWGQKGKKEGFKEVEFNWDTQLGKYAVAAIKDMGNLGFDTWQQAASALMNSRDVLNDFDIDYKHKDTILKWREAAIQERKVPSAPFVTETSAWVKLGLKVAMQHAIKEGADKISWTTGEQQNERYNLSNYVDRVEYTPNADGTWEVRAFEKHEPSKLIFTNEKATIKTIEDTFGKDIAEKINSDSGKKTGGFTSAFNRDTENNLRVLTGEGLKVGGKGMIGFYGSPTEGKLGIVGQVAESLFGKGSVKTTEIKIVSPAKEKFVAWDVYGGSPFGFETKQAAKEYIEKRLKDGGFDYEIKNENEYWEKGATDEPIFRLYEGIEGKKTTSTQHSIDITPEIKASVEKGLPLFQIIGEKGAANIPEVNKNLGIARDMEQMGKTPEEIWLATGWERSKDNGKWKFDFPDLKFIDNFAIEKQINDVYTHKKEYFSTTLGEVIKDDAGLFTAFPELKKILLEFIYDTRLPEQATYDAKIRRVDGSMAELIAINEAHIGKAITKLGMDKTGELLATQRRRAVQNLLIHEVQHAIQKREGFAKGGNSKDFKDKIIDTNAELKKELINVSSHIFEQLPEELKSDARRINRGEDLDGSSIKKIQSNPKAKIVWADWINARKQIEEVEKRPNEKVTKTAQEQYESLAGEVESRNAQKRATMTPAARKQQMLSETEDVAEESKIYLYDALKQNSNAQYRIENNQRIIEALQNFDGSPQAVSAIVHEFGHDAVVMILDSAKQGNETGLKHANTIVNEYNKANPKSKVTIDQLLKGNEDFKNGRLNNEYKAVQEFIARSWERYHYEGKQGFSKEFQEVLDAITEAFRQVYAAIKGSEIDVALSPKLRKMFDEILGKEETPSRPSPKGKEEEAISPGTRVLVRGGGPQPFVVVKEIPFNKDTDIEGERYYTIRNEKTGAEEDVEFNDLKLIKPKAKEVGQPPPIVKQPELPKPVVKEKAAELPSDFKAKIQHFENEEWKARREKGSYVKDGITYTRHGPLKADAVVLGNKGTSTFNPNIKESKIPFVYALVAFEDIVTTQKGVQQNPEHFMPESQPKPIDEGRDLQNKRRAEKFDNDEISVSGTDPFRGFMNVNERGEIFQGTGRWNILNYLSKEQIKERAEFLKSLSATTGITAEQIEQLSKDGKRVEIVKHYSIPDEQSVYFGASFGSQERESTPVGTAENQLVAKMDAGTKEKITQLVLTEVKNRQLTLPKILQDRGKDILKILGEKVISPTDFKKYMNTEGTISPEGVLFMERLFNAMLYDANTAALLAKIPSKIGIALSKYGGYILAVPVQHSIREDINASVDAFNKFFLSGIPFEDWRNSIDNVTGKSNRDNYSPLALKIAENFDRLTETQIGISFREYFDAVHGSDDMFSPKQAKPRAEAVKEVFGVEWMEAKQLQQEKLIIERKNDKIGEINNDIKALQERLRKKMGNANRDALIEEPKIKYARSRKNTIFAKEKSNEEKPQTYNSKKGEAILYHSIVSDVADTSGPDIRGKSGEAKGYSDRLKPNETCWAERLLTEKKGISFTGEARIKSSADVAYLFRHLEDAATENVFAVLINKNRQYKVLYLSTGSTTGSLVDAKLIYAAAKEFNAQSIRFVHNHPSGSLNPSQADFHIHKRMQGLLKNTGGKIQLEESIIINLDSGKYAIFSHYDSGGNYSEIGTRPTEAKSPKDIKVYEFDKQKLYTPSSERIMISSSQVIAEFLSQQKRGSVPKLGLIILDRNHNINRYVMEDVMLPQEELLDKIIENVGRSGEEIILVTNDHFDTNSIKIIKNKLGEIDIRLLDAIEVNSHPQIEQAYEKFKSLSAEGFLEPPAKYESPVGIDPETEAIVAELVAKYVQSGYYKAKDITKQFIKEGFEDLIIYLQDAYKEFRKRDDLSIELKNNLDSDNTVNSLNLKQIKDEAEKEKEREQKEADAEARRKSTNEQLGAQFRPLYDSRTGDASGASERGRPGLRYGNAEKLPSASEYVIAGQYPFIDEHQRYAINLAISQFKKGGKGFMLADGTGVGKTASEIITAAEMAKITGKPSVIITANKQVISDAFRRDAAKINISLAAEKVQLYTYDDALAGKIPVTEFGLLILDEAQNLKNLFTKTALAVNKITSDHILYATATPMDKPQGALYFIPQITNMTRQEAEDILKVRIVLNEKNEDEVVYDDDFSFDNYQKALTVLRNRAIEDGAMLRREYPFYGKIGETLLPVNAEKQAEENTIITYWDDKVFYLKKKLAGKWDIPIHKLPPDLKAARMALINILGQKTNELARWLEPQKVAYVFEMAKRELNNGNSVVIVAEGINPTVIKGLGNKTVPGFIGAIQRKFDDAAIRTSQLYGSSQAKKAHGISDFQSGNSDVLIMTPSSGGVGVNLDDTAGDKPRVMLIATANYGGDMMQQIFGRVSRRNTASQSRADIIFTNNTADIKRRKIMENKLVTLNNIQHGEEIEEQIDREEMEKEIQQQQKKNQKNRVSDRPLIATVSNYVSAKGNNVLVVKGDTFPIKRELEEKFGARWNGKLRGMVIFDKSLKAEVEKFTELLLQEKQGSKDRMTLDEKILNGKSEFDEAVKKSMGDLSMNPVNFDLYRKGIKLALLYMQKGVNKVEDFAKLVNRKLDEFLKKIWALAEKKFNTSPTTPLPRREEEELTETERVQLNKILDTILYNSKNSMGLLATEYDATIAATENLLQTNPNIIEKNTVEALKAMRDEIVTQGTVEDAELVMKRYGSKRRLAVKMLEDIHNVKPEKGKFFDKAKMWFRTISQNVDRPYKRLRIIQQNIEERLKIKPDYKVAMDRRFEQISGYVGRAIYYESKFIRNVVGKTKTGGRKLAAQEMRLLEDYLFAKRTIDRMTKMQANPMIGNRKVGNFTMELANEQLQHIKEVVGEKRFAEMEARAKTYLKFMDASLKKMVKGKLLSQEQYDKIKEQNDFYAAFAVVHSKFNTDFALQGQKAISTLAFTVRKIKGINPKVSEELTGDVKTLADAFNSGLMQLDEFYEKSLQVMDNALADGKISEEEYLQQFTELSKGGFNITSILNKSAEIIYNTEILLGKNKYMLDLAKLMRSVESSMDKNDVEENKKFGYVIDNLPEDYLKLEKQLNEKGLGLATFRENGIVKGLALEQKAAELLKGLTPKDISFLNKLVNLTNRIFRAFALSFNVGWQTYTNVVADSIRTATSRYGIVAGKDVIDRVANLFLFPLQYMEAFALSVGKNAFKMDSKLYGEFLLSPAYSKGFWEDLFQKMGKEHRAVVDERSVKEKTIRAIYKVLRLPLTVADIAMTSLEQTHKLVGFERGMHIEGVKDMGLYAMRNDLLKQLGLFGNNITHRLKNTPPKDLPQAIESIAYEVRNFAGSPDFQAIAPWAKNASVVFQFFGARAKGELTDYRRILNAFGVQKEGLRLTANERTTLLLQFGALAGTMLSTAISNIGDDDDEEEFDGISGHIKDNNMLVKTGDKFDWLADDGEVYTLNDYVQIPMRGTTATLNTIMNAAAKFWKGKTDKDTFRKIAGQVAGNASPFNLNGEYWEERFQSLISGTTPIPKFVFERTANLNTFAHRDLVPDNFGEYSMLQKYRRGELKPWEVATSRTPQWAKDLSRNLFEETGIGMTAIHINHSQATFMANIINNYMGENPLQKRMFLRYANYPVSLKEEQKKRIGEDDDELKLEDAVETELEDAAELK